MSKVHYDYAILRLVPRVEREEFFNVGVIVFCRQTDELLAEYALDEAKANLLGPALDLVAVKRHLAAIKAVCQGEAKFGSIASLAKRQRFDWLVAPKSAIIQTSAVHSGFAQSPTDTLGLLLAKYVD